MEDCLLPSVALEFPLPSVPCFSSVAEAVDSFDNNNHNNLKNKTDGRNCKTTAAAVRGAAAMAGDDYDVPNIGESADFVNVLSFYESIDDDDYDEYQNEEEDYLFNKNNSNDWSSISFKYHDPTITEAAAVVQ